MWIIVLIPGVLALADPTEATPKQQEASPSNLVVNGDFEGVWRALAGGAAPEGWVLAGGTTGAGYSIGRVEVNGPTLPGAASLQWTSPLNPLDGAPLILRQPLSIPMAGLGLLSLSIDVLLDHQGKADSTTTRNQTVKLTIQYKTDSSAKEVQTWTHVWSPQGSVTRNSAAAPDRSAIAADRTETSDGQWVRGVFDLRSEIDGAVEITGLELALAGSASSARIDNLRIVGTPSPQCLGDLDGDGKVDLLDSSLVRAKFGCAVHTGDAACDAADVTGDGRVNPIDLGALMSRFGPCQ